MGVGALGHEHGHLGVVAREVAGHRAEDGGGGDHARTLGGGRVPAVAAGGHAQGEQTGEHGEDGRTKGGGPADGHGRASTDAVTDTGEPTI